MKNKKVHMKKQNVLFFKYLQNRQCIFKAIKTLTELYSTYVTQREILKMIVEH